MPESQPSDAGLLAAYRAGDQMALGKLIVRYERPLYAFILRMTGRGEADDLYQETWVRAIRALATFDDRKPLSWLFRIARNLVVDRARRAKRWVPLESESGVEHWPAGGMEPGKEAADRDLGRRIGQAVALLPSEQREVFLMRTEGDLAFKEIARLQGVSINTALARMQYALEKLRTALKDLDGYEEIS
ncbi:MAG: sigma-70 family RNA polymerase sigma factor [Kiritimatiellia bacterium]